MNLRILTGRKVEGMLKSYGKSKKKLSPKPQNTPTAMLDKTGNLVTSSSGLEILAIDHYKKVLENREMNDDLKHIQKDKEELFEHRIDIAKTKKSQP